jgi:hypothetical protein
MVILQLSASFCAAFLLARGSLSYHLYYYRPMAHRQKRSVSLPPELAEAIDRAATKDGTTFSAWLANTASHRLRLESGRRGIAEWERDYGPLTPDELADGLARARALLGRTTAKRRRSA